MKRSATREWWHATQLRQRVRQRTQELNTAFEFSQEIAHHLDLSQLLESVASRARDLMQGEAASICLLKEDGHTLELAASSDKGTNVIGPGQNWGLGWKLEDGSSAVGDQIVSFSINAYLLDINRE